MDNGEMDDSSRTFNDRNELTQRIVADVTGTNTYDLTYDPNGNLTSDDEKYDYVYSPFGQLVQVIVTGGPNIVANYTYNALGHRNSEQTDTNDSGGTGAADGDVDAFDSVFFIATDMQGRRVATFRSTDTYAKECFTYHNPTGYGKAGAMGPLLRTRNSELTAKPNKWDVTTAPSTHDERAYYTSDFRGNVTAFVSSGGLLLEQYRYSATGVPMGIPQGDVNGDGKVESATSFDPDYAQSDYLDVNNVYNVRADWNLDGFVDSADTTVVGNMNGVVTGRLTMSAAAVRNWIAGRGVAESFNSTMIRYGQTLYMTQISVALGKPGGYSPSELVPDDLLTPFYPLSPTGFPANTTGRCMEAASLRECYKCCVYVDEYGQYHRHETCRRACDEVARTDPNGWGEGGGGGGTVPPPNDNPPLGGGGGGGSPCNRSPAEVCVVACNRFGRSGDNSATGITACCGGTSVPCICIPTAMPAAQALQTPSSPQDWSGNLARCVATHEIEISQSVTDCSGCPSGKICESRARGQEGWCAKVRAAEWANQCYTNVECGTYFNSPRNDQYNCMRDKEERINQNLSRMPLWTSYCNGTRPLPPQNNPRIVP